MAKPTLPPTSRSKRSSKVDPELRSKSLQKSSRRKHESSDVLVSAVMSTYLLTHLHQVLQGAEFLAHQEGRASHAANFAQLRKVLCMDARSMKDASAAGLRENDLEKFHNASNESKVA